MLSAFRVKMTPTQFTNDHALIFTSAATWPHIADVERIVNQKPSHAEWDPISAWLAQPPRDPIPSSHTPELIPSQAVTCIQYRDDTCFALRQYHLNTRILLWRVSQEMAQTFHSLFPSRGVHGHSLHPLPTDTYAIHPLHLADTEECPDSYPGGYQWAESTSLQACQDSAITASTSDRYLDDTRGIPSWY
jgi:hypothetical protein